MLTKEEITHEKATSWASTLWPIILSLIIAAAAWGSISTRVNAVEVSVQTQSNLHRTDHDVLVRIETKQEVIVSDVASLKSGQDKILEELRK
jgi:hypothetical protein